MLFGAQKIVIATAFGKRKSFYNGSLSRVKPWPYGAFQWIAEHRLNHAKGCPGRAD
jgi:hypothetical protein